MKIVLQLGLGVLAAIGGFVDIGDLVFATAAGAIYGYQLLWAVPLGVIGIAVYSEMCGRVAAVTGRPVIGIVRQRMGFGIGLVTLCASAVLNLLTVAAEIGGIALVLQLLLDVSYPPLVLVAVVSLAVVVWVLPFGWLEKVFGYLGLCLLVYVVGAVHLGPDWNAVGNGFVPSWHGSSLYAYYAVGLISAALMPYEVYFYSSGAVEEGWSTKDLSVNRINATVGYALGGVLVAALVVTAAEVFHPLMIQPEFIGTTALGAGTALGQSGLLLAMVGILFAVGGAAIDSCFAGAYSFAQFFGWEWGKYRKASQAPRFTIAWLGLFALAYIVVSTGVDPVMLTEYAVVGSVVALPFTYLPVLLVGRDRTFMGTHVNGRLSSALGWAYLVVVAVVAVSAIPLLIITNAGSG